MLMKCEDMSLFMLYTHMHTELSVRQLVTTISCPFCTVAKGNHTILHYFRWKEALVID